MALDTTRVVPDAAFVGVPLGPQAPGLVGTVGTSIAAIETGIGSRRRTILKVTAPISIVTTPDTAALAGGALIYTFPAGQIIVHEIYGDIGIDVDDNLNDEDTPEAGLGTLIGSGANATLGAVGAGAEDLWGPHVVAGCDVIAVAADAGQFVTRPGFVIASAGVHLVHFNLADTWANGAGTKDAFLNAGRFIIDWTLIPVEGV